MALGEVVASQIGCTINHERYRVLVNGFRGSK